MIIIMQKVNARVKQIEQIDQKLKDESKTCKLNILLYL